MFRLNPFFLLTLTISIFLISCKQEPVEKFDFELTFEKSKGKETATYDEIIAFYEAAAKHSENVEMKTMGKTDIDLPLHLITIKNQNSDDNALNLLINNGIHPGEPDGIDASMLMLKDIINGEIEFPSNVILHIIPSYNNGGMLNRNSTSRANQNGPEAYGFRGNARNLDLNRDFIKMDSENMKSFAKIFHKIKPDVYVETHVSNGADYQYTLTHLITQHNKLGHKLGQYTEKNFKLLLEKRLLEKDLIITPYVNVYGRTPFSGFSQFFDSPRYSTGYTALWNTLGLMIETHMLKNYDKRVLSTKAMLESLIDISSSESENIRQLRAENFKYFQNQKYYNFNYVIDSTTYSLLNFKGYEADYIKSKVTGKNRLKYYSDQPVERSVEYFNHFKTTDSLKIPEYYIVKSSWKKIMNRLALNGIEMTTLKQDSLINVESINIKVFKTYTSAYEGHYPHYQTQSEYIVENVEFTKGDKLIPTDQEGIRYIIETLEPELNDSFFNWNFFDTVLQQKEGFSAYVFEDYALKFLEENPEINQTFLTKKSNDDKFAKNPYAQLNWIYKQSPLYEKAHLRLPVFRVLD